MKKAILAALISLMTFPAMANEAAPAQDAQEAQGTVELQELSLVNPEFYLADELEMLEAQEAEMEILRDHDGRRGRDRDRDGRWDRDRDRDRDGRWDRDRNRRVFQCVAQNRLRQRFFGRDSNLRRAQRVALRTCDRSSRFGGCRIIGCSRRN